jgi:predicted secreted protein
MQARLSELGERENAGRKRAQVYPLRYVEDFFVGSNEVAVKPSKGATGIHFSPPC